MSHLSGDRPHQECWRSPKPVRYVVRDKLRLWSKCWERLLPHGMNPSSLSQGTGLRLSPTPRIFWSTSLLVTGPTTWSLLRVSLSSSQSPSESTRQLQLGLATHHDDNDVLDIGLGCIVYQKMNRMPCRQVSSALVGQDNTSSFSLYHRATEKLEVVSSTGSETFAIAMIIPSP